MCGISLPTYNFVVQAAPLVSQDSAKAHGKMETAAGKHFVIRHVYLDVANSHSISFRMERAIFPVRWRHVQRHCCCRRVPAPSSLPAALGHVELPSG